MFQTLLGLTCVTRLPVGLTHLRNHKFRYIVCDSLSSIYDCFEATETTKHYLLHYSNFIHERYSLLKDIDTIIPNFLSIDYNSFTQLLLYDDRNIIFIYYQRKRFDNPLALH